MSHSVEHVAIIRQFAKKKTNFLQVKQLCWTRRVWGVCAPISNVNVTWVLPQYPQLFPNFPPIFPFTPIRNILFVRFLYFFFVARPKSNISTHWARRRPAWEGGAPWMSWKGGKGENNAEQVNDPRYETIFYLWPEIWNYFLFMTRDMKLFLFMTRDMKLFYFYEPRYETILSSWPEIWNYFHLWPEI